MADRPMPFSAPMVLALLAGRKTQTRRSLKVQPPRDCGRLIVKPFHPTVVDRHGEEQPGPEVFGVSSEDGEWAMRLPIEPGMRLWVREAYWQRGHWVETPGLTKQGRVKWSFVPADDDVCFARPDGEVRLGRYHRDPQTIAWHQRLGRFMPRKYSRITLDVTDVRVERLQGILEEDAIAEGMPHSDGAPGPMGPTRLIVEARNEFMHLWDSINGPGAWAANPWIVAYSFRVHLCNIDTLEAGKC